MNEREKNSTKEGKATSLTIPLLLLTEKKTLHFKKSFSLHTPTYSQIKITAP